MAIIFHCGSGSPYSWRVWLALEHKKLAYEVRVLSFDRGDLKQPAFTALNPRGKVPVIQDGEYVLYESGAILEYLEDAYPRSGAALLPEAPRARGVARRLIREADEYLNESMIDLLRQVLFTPQEKRSEEAIAQARSKVLAELPHWQRLAEAANGSAQGFLAGGAGAVDFTVYPFLALLLRTQKRRPSLELEAALGSQIMTWMRRVEALPHFDRTYPPHWRA
jgi:glutathione S-transferase